MALQWLNRFFEKSKFQFKNLIPNQKKNKTYIIPTGFGFCFSVIILVLLYSSFASGNNFLYLYTFFLTSIGVTSLRLTNDNVSTIKIESVEIQDVFAGVPTFALVTLFNSSSRAKSFIEVYQKPHKKTIIAEIPANSVYQARIELDGYSRGLQTVPKLSVSTTFPFYLLNSWKVSRSKETFVVFPAPAGVSQFPVDGNLEDIEDSRIVDRKTGTDSEFAGHRKFETGDSFRQVDWKAYARTEKMLVKDYQSFRSQEVHLRWENTLFKSDVESRLCQLALWIEIAEAKGFQYSLELPGMNLQSQRGRSHYLRCLTSLALYGQDQNLGT